MSIAECFASIRAKAGVTGVAGVPRNTVTPRASTGVFPSVPEKIKQSQADIALVTQATPVTPPDEHDDEYWQRCMRSVRRSWNMMVGYRAAKQSNWRNSWWTKCGEQNRFGDVHFAVCPVCQVLLH